MARIVAFLHETLDMTLVYLALIGVALPFVVLFWFLFATNGFLLAVVLLGTALALFLMPVFEKHIRVFSSIDSKPLPESTLTFTFAKQMVRSPAIGGIYCVDAKTQFFSSIAESGYMRINRLQLAAVPERSSYVANFRVLEAPSLRIDSKIAGAYDISFNWEHISAQRRAAHAV
jgi:hypothetical protein